MTLRLSVSDKGNIDDEVTVTKPTNGLQSGKNEGTSQSVHRRALVYGS